MTDEGLVIEQFKEQNRTTLINAFKDGKFNPEVLGEVTREIARLGVDPYSVINWFRAVAEVQGHVWDDLIPQIYSLIKLEVNRVENHRKVEERIKPLNRQHLLQVYEILKQCVTEGLLRENELLEEMSYYLGLLDIPEYQLEGVIKEYQADQS